jgi:sugar phosphate isomerase/epimerase
MTGGVMMSVGILAHLFGKQPYKQLAQEVSSYGFTHIQLALWKAIDDHDFTKPGKLSPGLVRDIANEFNKQNVSISILACYLHLFDRDEEKRLENIARFKELLRYARSFGTTVVAVEVGKIPNGEFTDNDWLTLKASLKELVIEAEKWGVYIGIEPANEHLIGTAQSLKKLLDEVPSSNIGVVLDPGNLLTKENFHNQNQVIEEAFELLGNRIIACHAKDRKLDDEGQIQTVTPGRGQLNYPLYVKLLNKYKPKCDIILEHTKPDQMVEAKAFIETIRKETVV